MTDGYASMHRLNTSSFHSKALSTDVSNGTGYFLPNQTHKIQIQNVKPVCLLLAWPMVEHWFVVAHRVHRGTGMRYWDARYQSCWQK